MNISCDVICDLLPLYAENMLSEASRSLVDEHISKCESCRSRLASMNDNLPVPIIEENIKSAESLEKFRFRLLLIILGFPLWLPLIITLGAVALVLYICVWIVVICLWIIPISCAAGVLAGLFAFVVSMSRGDIAQALFFMGCILACAGVSILFFLLAKLFSAAVIKVTARMFKRKGGKRYV